MLEHHAATRRIDRRGGEASAKDARLVIGTERAGRNDAFNLAELLLASLSACILKGTVQVIPMLNSELRGVTAGRVAKVVEIWERENWSRMMITASLPNGFSAR